MLKFALRNLFSRKLRTTLSLLGLTVAIAGMIGLFSIAGGIDRMLGATFDPIPGLAAVQPGAPLPLFSTLPADWGDEIEEIEGVSVVLPEVVRRANVINRKAIVNPPRLLYGSDLEQRARLADDLIRDKILRGRNLTAADANTNHAVIALPIADEFRVDVGNTLTVNGHDLQIIGIYECKSIILDTMIVMDLETIRRTEGVAENVVSSFYIEALPDEDKQALVARIKDNFRGRELPVWQSTGVEEFLAGASPVMKIAIAIDGWLQTLQPPAADKPSGVGTDAATDSASTPQAVRNQQLLDETDPDLLVDSEMPLEVRTAQEWGEKFDKYADDLDIVLGALTAIGVIIAVLSIVNTMVMSVSERIIEFGILKANGWSRQNVLQLITFESGLIGLGGGLLGCLFGWLATVGINAAWPTRVDLYASPSLMAFGVVFALALGVFGGLYPAIWAMRLMPMDAIRRG